MSIRAAAGKVWRAVLPRLRADRDTAADACREAEEPESHTPAREDQWFWDHYDWAAGQVVAFLAEDGLSLASKDVADVGCGDGILDLGLVHRGNPRRLVGFDVNPVREDLLIQRASAAGVGQQLPPGLEFVVCDDPMLPAGDASFDVVVTWSAFEHIADPLGVLREIRRILKPTGLLFLQVWPFYASQHGGHLDEWYPEGFVQFQKSPDLIRREVLSVAENNEWAEYKLREFEKLNEITVDDLGRALEDAGFRVTMLELMTHRVNLPPEVRHLELTRVGVAGVMLLAR